jgi:hypothetical protein
VEYLSSCLDKAVKLLLKKNQIETKVPLSDNESRYFLIAPLITIPNVSYSISICNNSEFRICPPQGLRPA